MLKQVRRQMVCRTFAVLLLCQASAAWTAPEDDYRAGSQAYTTGDVVQAMALLRKSADAGHARSQSLLAYILDMSEANDEALAYYRKAVAQGDPEGEFALGSKYASGEGVKRDPVQARKLITSAAEKGNPSAIRLLAQAYIKGELGIDAAERGGADALRWVRRAADAGDAPALEQLANAYRTGAYGLAVDQKQAAALDLKVREARGLTAKGAARKQGAASKQEKK